MAWLPGTASVLTVYWVRNTHTHTKIHFITMSLIGQIHKELDLW